MLVPYQSDYVVAEDKSVAIWFLMSSGEGSWKPASAADGGEKGNRIKHLITYINDVFTELFCLWERWKANKIITQSAAGLFHQELRLFLDGQELFHHLAMSIHLQIKTEHLIE